MTDFIVQPGIDGTRRGPTFPDSITFFSLPFAIDSA
jgi:hypothetical protein